ncbi:adhesion G protein-coupled receptor F5-like [Salminus brasiliensis]|uniref:adhesion G protein-coupled receptor F5-like n=1 Tax=Salminus brasiliensis TaxID=930266 RepID=UPI003B838C8E
MALTVDKPFLLELSDQSSTTFKEYKAEFESLIDASYANIKGYIQKSAVVTNFRPGSVIADFTIGTTTDTLDFATANSQLTTNFQGKGYAVKAIIQSEEGGMHSGFVYPMQEMILTCKYECSATVDAIPHVKWQQITIQPYPNIQVTNDKTLECGNIIVPLRCCAESSYILEWKTEDNLICDKPSKAGCITCSYKVSQTDCQEKGVTAQCLLSLQELQGFSYGSKTIKISTTKIDFPCNDLTFGTGTLNQIKEAPCDGDMHLQPAEVPVFVANLSTAAESNADQITGSAVTVIKIVDILIAIAEASQTIVVNQPVMEDFLNTVDVIGSDKAKGTWTDLNKNTTTQNASSELLKSVEFMGKKLSSGSFEIKTNTSHLQRASFSQSFQSSNNFTTQIHIPSTSNLTFITTIVFSSLNSVLPVRNSSTNVNESSKTGVVIKGDVAAVIVDNVIYNISLTFDINKTSLETPQCVFWNFSLLNGIGGWDTTGCNIKPVKNQTDKLTCECDHTTSFSILMSPFVLDSPVLDYITYIGVGISMICLILCFIIEGIIWKPMTRNDTSYMRHVSIVNIALSLLIADICFIIGAAIVKKGQVAPVGPCSTATFFMHFFYLALFFWMLLSALLLLYRTVVVFAGMSRTKMMVIAFTVGYGAPLLIAVITVAVTAGGKGYIVEKSACWLNWEKTRAFLAFVIPALTIVAINLVVLAVVLYKMLRRGVGATTQPEEKHAIVVIARCVAILTPLFGLTWGFGIGTMVSGNLGIHIVFAILNSLQGLFILVFGILLDNKIREALKGKLAFVNISSNRTRSTSAGPSSSSGIPFIRRLRQRNAYNISENSGTAASSSSNSDTYTDT